MQCWDWDGGKSEATGSETPKTEFRIERGFQVPEGWRHASSCAQRPYVMVGRF